MTLHVVNTLKVSSKGSTAEFGFTEIILLKVQKSFISHFDDDVYLDFRVSLNIYLSNNYYLQT